jgi:hypothetical protein
MKIEPLHVCSVVSCNSEPQNVQGKGTTRNMVRGQQVESRPVKRKVGGGQKSYKDGSIAGVQYK